MSLIFVSPLLWMVTTAIKPIEETMTATPTLLPSKFLWDNFPKAVTYGSKELGYIPFLLYARNTLMVTLLCVAGSVCSNAVVAYAFARLRWPGRDAFFARDARYHDGPLPGTDGPNIWPLQVARLGRNLPTSLGTGLLRQRLLHFSAAPVL